MIYFYFNGITYSDDPGGERVTPDNLPSNVLLVIHDASLHDIDENMTHVLVATRECVDDSYWIMDGYCISISDEMPLVEKGTATITESRTKYGIRFRGDPAPVEQMKDEPEPERMQQPKDRWDGIHPFDDVVDTLRWVERRCSGSLGQQMFDDAVKQVQRDRLQS